MGTCPKCNRKSLFYDPASKSARCWHTSCGFKQMVGSEAVYTKKFESDQDFASRTPCYDLSFMIIKSTIYRSKECLNNKLFFFYGPSGDFTGKYAATLSDFCEEIDSIDIESIEFHYKQYDFENWLCHALQEDEVAREITNLRCLNLGGSDLRKQLYQTVFKHVEKRKTSIISNTP